MSRETRATRRETGKDHGKAKTNEASIAGCKSAVNEKRAQNGRMDQSGKPAVIVKPVESASNCY